jgi:hypothetical protein
MTTGNDASDGFFSRWSRRKELARDGSRIAPAVAPVEAAVPEGPTSAPLAEVDTRAPELPPPTMDDVAQLTRESDYTRFVAAHVDVAVKRAAMKKLFSDPHFNVMDGLDTYIADYGLPDPIPIAMLRQMNQSKLLRLFDVEPDSATTPPERPAGSPDAPIEPDATHDDDPDLRLQQDDDAGRAGPDEGARA